MIRAAAVAPLLAALACGGGSALPTDGAAPPADAGQVPVSCELATQSGCALDQQCSPFCDDQLRLVVACRAEPAGAPAVGAPCVGVTCARGSTCVGVAGKEPQCVKFCAASEDCATGQACRTVNTVYGCAASGPKSVSIKACL